GSLELALRAPTEKNREMVSAATWAALADYALENNGTDIEQLNVVEEKEEAVTIPDIQVFRGGREL
ncbi:MAG: hypothetical protein GX606_05120, partial [Elusimicrobia bacterium]|nr:hypothetical protein [Elusimicrobiota bacterium]